MDDELAPGLRHEFGFRVPEDKVVAALFPESDEFAVMPPVLATGFLVGFVEWACIRAVRPFLDWPREQTVGTFVELSHEAPTPPGLVVTATVGLTEVDGRRLRFAVEVTDGPDLVCRGHHERMVIDTDRFNARVSAKAARYRTP